MGSSAESSATSAYTTGSKRQASLLAPAPSSVAASPGSQQHQEGQGEELGNVDVLDQDKDQSRKRARSLPPEVPVEGRGEARVPSDQPDPFPSAVPVEAAAQKQAAILSARERYLARKAEAKAKSV